MLMTCVPLPKSAGPQTTLALLPFQPRTKRSRPQRSDHSHFPSFASHMAIQQNRARFIWVIDLPLKHSLGWWLYHCSPLSIDLVVLPCSIRMARELTAPRLLTIAITNEKSAAEWISGSAYYPRRAYVS